jgi:hypothetical protein
MPQEFGGYQILKLMGVLPKASGMVVSSLPSPVSHHVLDGFIVRDKARKKKGLNQCLQLEM